MAQLAPTNTFDFGPRAASLLDQLDERLDASTIGAAAKAAASWLMWAYDQPAVKQEQLARDATTGRLQGADLQDVRGMELAVVSATLLMTAKMGPMTASAKIRKSLDILSERYQADW